MSKGDKNLKSLMREVQSGGKDSSSMLDSLGLEALAARIAVEVWRARRRLETVARADGGRDGLEPIENSLTRLEDILAEAEVEMVEHDGEQYDPGMRLKVLHDRSNGENVVVVQTIAPTVLLKGVVKVPGEVVLGEG